MQQAFHPIERLSQHVIRIMGLNPGPNTLQGSNTYLVGKGYNRILIDTGVGKEEYLESLRTVVDEEKCTIKGVVITHWHLDHTGGIRDVLKLFPESIIYKRMTENLEVDVEHQANNSFKYTHLEDGQVITADGIELESIYSPGHTDDHMALYLKEENAYFSGDCILGHTSSVISNLKKYIDSLRYVLTKPVQRIYTGHGQFYSGNDECRLAVEGLINHRLTRENQILSVFEKNPNPTFEELFQALYSSVTDATLKKMAALNLKVHLQKLADEDKVREVKERESYSLI